MYSEEHFVYDNTVRADSSKESKSIPKQGHFGTVIESEPVQGMEYRGDDDDDMAYPPEELLMSNDSLQTMLKSLWRDSR